VTSVIVTGFIAPTSPENPTWRFPAAARLFSYMDAFGMGTDAAGERAFLKRIPPIGRKRFSATASVTPPLGDG